MNFCIVSVGWRCQDLWTRTLESIEEQSVTDWRARIVYDGGDDAGPELRRWCDERDDRWSVQVNETQQFAVRNQVEAIAHLAPADDDVVVFLDLDGDRLAHPDVLARLIEHYDHGALVTYGSYQPVPHVTTCAPASDFPPAVVATNGYRRHMLDPGGACHFNHLRTISGRVINAIPPETFRWPDGRWYDSGCDYVFMVAALELAGGRHCCQPPGTMVTVVTRRGSGPRPVATAQVPIEELAVGDLVVSYSQAKTWIRKQGSRVTHISRHTVSEPIVVVTCGDHETRMTAAHRCVVRLGAGWFNKWFVYLMRRGQSYRVGMVRGRHYSDNGGFGLRKRLYKEGAEAAWILSAHDTASEARIAELLTAYTYHLPQLMFRSTPRSSGVTQESLDLIWSKIGDNSALAERALSDYGRRIEFPLIEADSGQHMIRSCQTVRACNLVDGMEMLPLSGAARTKRPDGSRTTKQSWVPVSVAWEFYDGPVYGLLVEDDETYVADGVVTHNCIEETLMFYNHANPNADYLVRAAATAECVSDFLHRPPLAPLP